MNKINKKKKEKVKLEEWGPSINGYRFVDTKKGNHYYKQRHNLIIGEKDSYEWSYEELPEFKFNGYDYLNDKYNDDEWNYNEYLKYWEKLKNDKVTDKILKFPIFENNELNIENIKKFLKTNNEGLNIKILKRERIRWHPDKIFQLLPIDNETNEQFKELINTTFQCINELYNEFNLK